MRIKWKDPMIVMCRTWGKDGKTAEIGALLDFNYHYCCISRGAALALGFPEGASTPSNYAALRPDRVPTIIGFRGLETGILITLPRVSLGPLEARNVETIVFELDLPKFLPADMVLGNTFLKNFRLSIDYDKGYVSLQQRKSTESTSGQHALPDA